MIYVDMDHTLIDSQRRFALEMAAAMRRGVTEAQYFEAIDVIFRVHGIGKFCYELLREELAKLCPTLTKDVLGEWEEILTIPMLLPHVEWFLGRFPRKDLTLLTTGNPVFQQKKIDVHGLAP